MDISPLFAVDAEELLEQGNVQEAIELCLKGLEVYPGYPAGEALLARAYKILGDSNKANEILASAIEKNPLNKALDTLKKYDLEIENVEKIHREPRFKPAFKRKKKKRKVTEKDIKKISLKDIQLEDKEISVNDFYDDLESNDNSEEISNELNENLLDDSKLDQNELDQNDLLNDFVDDDSSKTNSIEEDFENDSNKIEEITLEPEDDIIKETEIFEDTKGITIDFEDVELIPGLSHLDFRLNLKDIKSFELTNIDFDYNIFKFDKNYKINLINTFQKLSLNELASKLNDAKIGKLKNDLPEPEIVDYNVEEIATETMAEIYHEQGAFDEAIKVYNNLIIKYPKKSDYFKQKISEVLEAKENDLNNIKTFNLGN